MSRDIAESDWKVLRKLHPVALDRFCRRILAEIESVVADSSRSHQQRYVAIYQLVERRDREIADAFNDVIELNQRMSTELDRLSRVVGKEGKISQRASLGPVSGSWLARLDVIGAADRHGERWLLLGLRLALRLPFVPAGQVGAIAKNRQLGQQTRIAPTMRIRAVLTTAGSSFSTVGFAGVAGVAGVDGVATMPLPVHKR